MRGDKGRLRVDIEHEHRRARSVAPRRPDYADEADYITSKIDSRGRMGEAWNGATKDWAIVDVPPGTERVKMDGVGGGSAEVTWQRYNGVRRSKFIPERDGTVVTRSSSTSISEPVREPVAERDRLSVQIYDKHREKSRDRAVVEDVHDTRISIRDRDRDRERRPKRQQEMWTEITKDLVVREAIERLGYEYEETEWFFYVMEYLRYVSSPPCFADPWWLTVRVGGCVAAGQCLRLHPESPPRTSEGDRVGARGQRPLGAPTQTPPIYRLGQVRRRAHRRA